MLVSICFFMQLYPLYAGIFWHKYSSPVSTASDVTRRSSAFFILFTDNWIFHMFPYVKLYNQHRIPVFPALYPEW